MQSDKLKALPCPFCGKDAETDIEYSDWAACPDKGCAGYRGADVPLWNRRALTRPVPDPEQQEGWLTSAQVECMAKNGKGLSERDLVTFRHGELQALCRMALAALNGPPAVDWMPIESAPKDGTEIIVSCGSDKAHVYWWSAREGHGEWLLVHTGDYATSSSIEFTPTHWLPLPPAPTDHKEPER